MNSLQSGPFNGQNENGNENQYERQFLLQHECENSLSDDQLQNCQNSLPSLRRQTHLSSENLDSDSSKPIKRSDSNFNINKSFPYISLDSLTTQSTILDNVNSSDEQRAPISSRGDRRKRSQIVIRKFKKLDQTLLSSTPAPDVKIGQRIAYKEYYGNEFGTIRWIGRVPQICPDWTVGIEFDNAIGEGDGSLHGRRYFIAKDCFAKFLPLDAVSLVDQHVGRPEPGTMISVMSAAVRPGQMISIQRVSTVHVQHCFLNAPHHKPGADILAVNTRLHCQCPNCGPCAHVIKPPRTQRLPGAGKNAAHMCQYSTYTCCGMESQEETLCTYTGNKVVSLPPPRTLSSAGLPPIGNSWIDGSGYLTSLQAQQRKLMPDEYKFGTLPEDIGSSSANRRLNKTSSRRGSGRQSSHGHKSDDCSHDKPEEYDSYSAENCQNFSCQADCETCLQGSSMQDFKNYNHDHMNSRENQKKIEQRCPEDRTSRANSIDEDQKKVTRFLYRDSIENRYLFPTDDSIGSTLEADLENLSRARYGHSGGLINSKMIMKSLRSLVSCIRIQTNQRNTLRVNSNRATRQTSQTYDLINDESSSPIYNERSRNDYQRRQSYNHLEMHDATIMNQVSSSSDCGFSSASQNSTNFQSYPNNSPIMPTNDDRKTFIIYKRILDRLMQSTTISDEELYKLEKILLAPRMVDSSAQNELTQDSANLINTDEADTMIADIIRRSILHTDETFANQSISEPHHLSKEYYNASMICETDQSCLPDYESVESNETISMYDSSSAHHIRKPESSTARYNSSGSTAGYPQSTERIMMNSEFRFNEREISIDDINHREQDHVDKVLLENFNNNMTLSIDSELRACHDLPENPCRNPDHSIGKSHDQIVNNGDSMSEPDTDRGGSNKLVAAQ